ncbi:hypothetical protein [Luteimonas deserti]|uniref:Uncharacterized protein n=1 Tax=Luteimonas deserti TaxID=2752306 RepID=A0A7Z0TYF8_9GAMM|nr:hypothetical protein [Luteimonas deserti]NYZ62870.1 hypothetical protein [Luteimonas deserti]
MFALDLDGDDAPDGLATYTLEGCGGGNHYRRMLLVLRGGGDAWRPALDAVLGAKHATRRIHSIAAGALVLGPSGDAPGASEAAPEILSLPPAEGPLP